MLARLEKENEKFIVSLPWMVINLKTTKLKV